MRDKFGAHIESDPAKPVVWEVVANSGILEYVSGTLDVKRSAKARAARCLGLFLFSSLSELSRTSFELVAAFLFHATRSVKTVHVAGLWRAH